MFEVIYDRKSHRYRDKEKGFFVSKEAFLNIQLRYLEKRQNDLVAMAARIYDDPSPATLKDTCLILKDIHLLSAIIGANGVENLFANDYLKMGDLLRSQYGLAYNKPKPFGLKFLLEDVAAGRVSESQLAYRLRLFAQSGKSTRFSIELVKQRMAGKTEGKRVLGATHIHCKPCLNYAGQGWISLLDIVIPTFKCDCYTNCECRILYR